jgi:CIC family chloride channel protein
VIPANAKLTPWPDNLKKGAVNDRPESDTGDRGDLVVLALLSLVVGVASGLLCAVFRLALMEADWLRGALIAWAQGGGAAGFLLVVGILAAGPAVAAWLVRRFSPDAVGSGIPQVEAVLSGEEPTRPLRHASVKFVGGLLAIGAGLALGREGPSVQMGAAVADVLGRAFRRNWRDCRVLFAAGAGAGLATAFNAPIAGAVFVLEELLRRFETRTAIAALGASAGAIAVARVLLGVLPDFQVEPQPFPGLGTEPIHMGLGIVAGILGVAYSRALLGALVVADRMDRWPAELRAALVGAAVGVLAWFSPDVVGGGDPITQRTLTGAGTLSTIALVFALRFVLGPVSYAAGTPGGLFAPMLVLGAQIGVMYGFLCDRWLSAVASDPTAYGVVGMAAFFTAVVRAPLTGIVLATEMTGIGSLYLPMLASCFAAMAVPTLLQTPPIYESLKQRLAQSMDSRR